MNLTSLPKAELHLHLEGAMRYSTATELSERYGLPMPPSGSFPDLTRFTVAYERARELIGDLDDLRRVAREVVLDAHAQGVVWTEVHFFPATYAGRLGPDEAVLDAVLDGLATGAKDVDNESAAAVLLGINRSFPIEAAERTVELAGAYQRRGVVGLGLAGDEVNFPAEPFADVFVRAAALGLRAYPHAGEGAGADSVQVCVESLGARRVNHGIRAVEDEDLLKHLVERDICLDVCPTSNLALNVVPSLAEHPLPKLLEAGVPVSINSDVPLFVQTSLLQEYELLMRELGFSTSQLAQIAESSLRHSSCPSNRLTAALASLEQWHQD